MISPTDKPPAKKATNLCNHHLLRTGDPKTYAPDCPNCHAWADRVEATEGARERAAFARRARVRMVSEGELDPHTGAPAEGRTIEVDDDPEIPAREAPHVCLSGETWVEHDGRGIPLVRVCAVCVEGKLARYRPEILRPYTQADVDERIEEETF